MNLTGATLLEIKKIPPLASKQLEPLLISISDIRPHPDNYKVHPPEQIASLRASLKAFGVTSPIKANLEGFIVAGHGMYQLYLEDGYTHVPVIYEALDKNLSKAYLVADNETARRAVTEQDKLNELLEGALSIPDFDIEAVGFSVEDIDSLLQSGEPVEVVEDEFNPDGEIETRCKEGDLWQLGRHRLLCGDSTKKEAVAKLMKGSKADMVFTDPPYNIDYGNIKHPKFKVRNIENDNMSGEQFEVFCNKFVENISSFCDHCVYVCGAPGQDGRIMFSALDNKLHCSTTIVWNKDTFTLGRGKYQNKYEPIWFGWNVSGENFTEERNLSNVWDISRPKSSDLHPTMKPIDLIAKAINDASKPHQLILDLFLGSGSTLIACEQLNRTCYGMELDPHYCDVILSRWEQFTNQTAKKLN